MVKQVGTAGELLDFVKNNKDSKVIFKEDKCLAIKSHQLHCCCGQRFYSSDEIEIKLINLIKQVEKILEDELPNSWLHPLFDKYSKFSSFNPKDLELILGNINLRILQRMRTLTQKEIGGKE